MNYYRVGRLLNTLQGHCIERLNDTAIDHNYPEIHIKQIEKEYFNHAHYECKTHGHKRKDRTFSMFHQQEYVVVS